jgi:hypothetical protein
MGQLKSLMELNIVELDKKNNNKKKREEKKVMPLLMGISVNFEILRHCTLGNNWKLHIYVLVHFTLF